MTPKNKSKKGKKVILFVEGGGECRHGSCPAESQLTAEPVGPPPIAKRTESEVLTFGGSHEGSRSDHPYQHGKPTATVANNETKDVI